MNPMLKRLRIKVSSKQQPPIINIMENFDLNIDNYDLEDILNLFKLKELGYPVLIGVSRKSFLTTDNNSPYERLYASLGVEAVSVMNGANILRVHDVYETNTMLSIIDRIKN